MMASHSLERRCLMFHLGLETSYIDLLGGEIRNRVKSASGLLPIFPYGIRTRAFAETSREVLPFENLSS